jgi:integrase/recombinase XerD
MNFSEAVDIFLRRKSRDLAISKGVASPRTMETYRYRLEDFARYLLKKKHGEDKVEAAREDPEAFEKLMSGLKLEKVTADDIGDYLFECLQAGITAPTINTRLYTLRSMWKELAKSQGIEDISKEIPRARYQYKRKASLTRGHLYDLINQLKIDRDKSKNGFRNYIFFQTIRFYGLRISEALSLKVTSIHLLEDSIKLEILGKGNKHRVRTLPLFDLSGKPIKECEEYYNDFKTYLQEVRKKFKAPDLEKGPVFYSQTGNVWNEDSARLAFKNAIKKISLQMYHYTPHSLRHAFVSHKLADGVPLQTVSRLVDHANVSITSTIYAHSEEQDLIDGMTKGIKLEPEN